MAKFVVIPAFVSASMPAAASVQNQACSRVSLCRLCSNEVMVVTCTDRHFNPPPAPIIGP